MTTLGTRALNRATLARQHLLERASMPAVDMVAHLYGLQAQAPMPPYFALWTRLNDFVPEQLSALISDRSVVRIVTMRGTVHALTAADALELRALTQPIMDRDLVQNALHGVHLKGIDFAALAKAGRELVEREPMTAVQLRPLLAESFADRDPAALAHGIRGLLPLVQVPPRGIWGKAGQPALTTLDSWLGTPMPAEPSPDRMVLRYLAAYGPATVADIQAWSGLTRLGEVVDRNRAGLVEFGSGMFDLPDAPRPDPETPSPVRFLAPFDNVLLSYADRTRIMDNEYKKLVFTQNGIIKPAVLVDGQVAGYSAITHSKGAAVLDVRLFGTVPKKARTAIEREGRQLLAFAHPDATADVRIEPC